MTDQLAQAMKALDSNPGSTVPIPGNGPSLPQDASASASPTSPTQETPVAAETKPEASKEVASKHFAAIAKRERDLVRKQREIEEREKALSTREVVPSASEVRKQYALNPLKALEELGITYEQLTDFVLNDQKPTEELKSKSIQEQIEELKAERAREKEEAAKKAEDDAKAEHSKAVSDFQEEVNSFLLTNNEKYELIGLHDHQQVVMAVIEQHYQATKAAGKPRIMSIEEASDLVERDLEEKTERLLKANKIQAKIAPKHAETAPTKPSQSDEPQFQTSTPKTLTNNLSSTAPNTLPANTEAERIRRAMAALG